MILSNKVKGNGFILCLRGFRLDIRNNFTMRRVVRLWNSMSREVLESPSLESVQERLKWHSGMWFCGGVGCAGLAAVCSDPRGLFSLSVSMILCFCDHLYGDLLGILSLSCHNPNTQVPWAASYTSCCMEIMDLYL